VVSAGPVLDDLGIVFGLGSIVWFVWLGVAMLRGGSGVVVEPTEVVVPSPNAVG
jgi:hypothetical protein